MIRDIMIRRSSPAEPIPDLASLWAATCCRNRSGAPDSGVVWMLKPRFVQAAIPGGFITATIIGGIGCVIGRGMIVSGSKSYQSPCHSTSSPVRRAISTSRLSSNFSFDDSMGDPMRAIS